MIDSPQGHRLFLGIALSDDARDQVCRCAQALRQSGIVADNWSDPSLYHITLLFLGQTSSVDAERISQAVSTAVLGNPHFTLTLNAIGGFRRSKVLWMGLQKDEGLSSLVRLHSAVRNAVETAAPTVVSRLDERPYAPHLTLARKLNLGSVQARDTSRDAFLLESDCEACSIPVSEVSLFKSIRIEGDLCYPVVERFEFGEGGGLFRS